MKILAAFLVLCGSWAFGFQECYGPFAEGDMPEEVALKPFRGDVVPGANGQYSTVRYEHPTVTNMAVVVRWPDNATMDIEADGALTSMALPFNPITRESVYLQDLNGDGTGDFLLEGIHNGLGLACAIKYDVVVLSTPSNWVVRTITSYGTRFVDRNNDGVPELWHTTFVVGEKGRDKKRHNYWVHNLLKFTKDGRIVSANRHDPRFPAWMWYTYKPNHQNSTQLTAEQRQRCWQKRTMAKEGTSGALFPGAAGFTKEQADNLP